MNFSPVHGIYAALVLGAVFIGAVQYDRSQKQQSAIADFVGLCEQDYEADWCAQQVTDYHDDCYVRNHEHRSDGMRRTKGYDRFYAEQYHDCLYKGFEDWNAAMVTKSPNIQGVMRWQLGDQLYRGLFAFTIFFN